MKKSDAIVFYCGREYLAFDAFERGDGSVSMAGFQVLGSKDDWGIDSQKGYSGSFAADRIEKVFWIV